MKRNFTTLDGMRGLAAMVVMVGHMPLYFGNFDASDGYLAVDLFFALSGFVLCHAYGDKLDKGMSPWRFMGERAIRLYPLYAVGLALGVLVEVIALRAGHRAMSGSQIATAGALGAFMLPGPGGKYGAIYPLDVPCWSLLFELLVNLAMVLLWRRLSNRVLFGIVGAAACGLAVASITLGRMDCGYSWATLWVGVPRVTFSFFLGMLIYRNRDRLTPGIAPWLALAIEAALLLVRLPESVRPLFDLGCIFFAFPLLIASAVQREPVKGARVYQFLGATSYAVYVLHDPMQRVVHGLVLKLSGLEVGAWKPLSGLVFAALLLGACWAMDEYYDKPARKWLRDLLTSPRQSVAAA
jgi:peptidoglycan/LPS O-acetylase OafA/YrhL